MVEVEIRLLEDYEDWAPKLIRLHEMVQMAEASGLRFKHGRRGVWKWEPGFYPLEYLKLTQEFAHAPEWVREEIAGVTA